LSFWKKNFGIPFQVLFEGKQIKMMVDGRKKDEKRVEIKKANHRNSFFSRADKLHVISFCILPILK